jgi:hypothetical protein
MSKVDESVRDADASKAAKDDGNAAQQPPLQFPMMAVPYAAPQAAVGPGLVRRFSTVAYLPTAYGYMPFAIDIIK